MKTGKWPLIGAFAERHIGLLAAILFSGLVFNLLTLLIPVAIGRFYELLFRLQAKKLQLLESFGLFTGHDFETFLLVFTGLIAGRFLFEYLNRYLIAAAGEKFVKELREQLFAHQLQAVYPVYEESGTGKYLLRYSGDLKGVQNYLTRGLLRFAQDILLLFIFLALVAWLSRPFALVVGLGGVLAWGLLAWLNRGVFRLSEERRNRRSGMLAFVSTRLRAILSIKVFNKYSPELKRYQRRSDKLYRIGLRYQRLVNLIYALVPAITYLLIALLMALIYYYYLPQQADLPGQSTLLVLILLTLSLLPLMRRVMRVSVVWKLGSISFRKLSRILELPAEDSRLPQGKPPAPEQIVFRQVYFRYPSGTVVFSALDFRLTRPGLYAFTGRPGSGKTTLLKLLTGIYRPDDGEILYGHTSHARLSEAAIRKQIAVVSASLPLYGNDVYEAVTYSRNPQRKERAARLLEHLQQEEPAALRLSLTDKIGELGGNLTAGQQKLLMYVRALLTNKPVLIAEEPLAGLHHPTARLIGRELATLAAGKLVIVLDTGLPQEITATAHYRLVEGKARPL